MENKFNNIFNVSGIYVSKKYCDSQIKLIRRENILTDREEVIIRNALIKYYFVKLMGFLGFLYAMRKYYYLQFWLDYSKPYHQFEEHFKLFLYGFCSLTVAKLLSQKLYLDDLRMMIVRYSGFNKQKYLEVKMNKLIADTYKI